MDDEVDEADVEEETTASVDDDGCSLLVLNNSLFVVLDKISIFFFY